MFLRPEDVFALKFGGGGNMLVCSNIARSVRARRYIAYFLWAIGRVVCRRVDGLSVGVESGYAVAFDGEDAGKCFEGVDGAVGG